MLYEVEDIVQEVYKKLKLYFEFIHFNPIDLLGAYLASPISRDIEKNGANFMCKLKKSDSRVPLPEVGVLHCAFRNIILESKELLHSLPFLLETSTVEQSHSSST